MPSEAQSAVVKAACSYLTETGSIDAKTSKTNKQVVGALRKREINNLLISDLSDGTLISYLSIAANKIADSGIVSGGRRGGYWYEKSSVVAEEPKPVEEQKIPSDKGKDVVVSEKDLYPLMELWLQKKGYTSKDVSNLKSGGRWGNPDIIGIDRVESLGAIELDLSSCEIKLYESNWEQFIFEAISHKRFANRSWFCYRVQNDEQPLPKGIEYYAERYRVGVIHVVLSDAELIDLKNSTKKPIDYIERVDERIPALYDYVPLREQRDLIERAGIAVTLKF